jgi:hypothetical protein
MSRISINGVPRDSADLCSLETAKTGFRVASTAFFGAAFFAGFFAFAI